MDCLRLTTEWMACAFALALGAADPPANAASDLSRRLSEYIQLPDFERATWGIHMVTLDNGAVLFSTNGHRLLQPASSAKLLVAGMALERFGSEHVWVTTLHADGAVDADGRLQGRLVVRGSGDFSWSDTFGAGRPQEVLSGLARQVKQAKILRISGGLVADTRLFAGPTWGVGWAWDDLQYGYGARPSSLMLRDNRVECVVQPGSEIGHPCELHVPDAPGGFQWSNDSVTGLPGVETTLRLYREPGNNRILLAGRLAVDAPAWRESLSVPDPALWFLAEFRLALSRQGIAVDGPLQVFDAASARQEPDPDDLPVLGRTVSPSMRELVRAMVQSSQNQYAQMLLLHAGVARAQSAQDSASGRGWTADAGLEVLKAFARQAGAPGDEVRLDEASGLARSDRMSPAALVQVLRYMHQHREREAFWASLPVTYLPIAGARAEVRAKSGTMSDIFALAGYCMTPKGDRLAFSVMLNGHVVADPEQGKAAVWGLLKQLMAER